jgi:hypothetical protein
MHKVEPHVSLLCRPGLFIGEDRGYLFRARHAGAKDRAKNIREPGEFGWKLTRLLNKCSYLKNSQNKNLCTILHKKKW